MNKNQQRPFMRRFFGSRLFLIVLLVLAILVALNFARAYYQDIKIREEIKQLEQEVKNLEQRKIESLDILSYVTSKEFVEEKARTELNMLKPGENSIVIQQDTNRIEEKESMNTEHSNTYLGNPIKWWYYFTHRDI